MTLSVVIPALNEAGQIASVVSFARACPRVREVIVIDDGSIDGTPELAQQAGARVLTSTLRGKGVSMAEGVHAAQEPLVLFLDGDLRGLKPDLIETMAAPLVYGNADMVKGRFTRAAGRVTTLTARPLLQVFFPTLADIAQPLGGIMAGRREFLGTLPYETDYGVDIGLLIDAWARGARIEEADIGHLEHDSQPLDRLGLMADQVVRTILNRAHKLGRLQPSRLSDAEVAVLQSQAELSQVLHPLRQGERLALFDMDGTLLQGRFVVELARSIGRGALLQPWLDRPGLDAVVRMQHIAKIFAGVSKVAFEAVARAVPLMPGAAETVIALKKMGHRVGIVTDSYLVAAETVRRRVFADFSVANLLRFREGRATGEITIAPALLHTGGCTEHRFCKRNVMTHLMERLGLDASRVLAVGDGVNDVCMLEAAGSSVAFEPKHHSVLRAGDWTANNDLREVLRVYEGAGREAAVSAA